MWDTGVEISGVSKQADKEMKAEVDVVQWWHYREINGNINNSCGTASINFGDALMEAHVIDGLSFAIIIGRDVIFALQGKLESKARAVTIYINQKQATIPFLSDTKFTNAIQTNKQYAEIIDNIINSDFKNIIAINPNKPSVLTKVMEFEIDTGDHPPVFIRLKKKE